MKKVLFTSLLLVIVFLISSSGVALAQCSNYQDFSCSATVYMYGKIIQKFTSCIELCDDDDFGVGLSGPSFTGYLYPTDNGRNHWGELLGTFSEMSWGFGGLFAKRGNSDIRVKFSFIQDGGGVVDVFQCHECKDCCRDDD